jgi:hypothetical protein
MAMMLAQYSCDAPEVQYNDAGALLVGFLEYYGDEHNFRINTV